MAENITLSSESDTNDDLVPTFSKASGNFVFPDGVEFSCSILTDKINKERSFKRFFINDDEEEE